ncbi:MAG: regulatory protein [Sphingobacteriales bacterium]|jgi:regulatory protein
MLSTDDFKKLLYSMQRYCVLGERCRRDIKQKLEKKEVDEIAITKIIEALEYEKFVDEKRYASAFTNDKFKFNHWGRLKIKSELFVKELPYPFILDGLKRINAYEYRKKIFYLAEKKLKHTQADNVYTLRDKVARHLYSKGFEPDIFWPLLKELITDNHFQD